MAKRKEAERIEENGNPESLREPQGENQPSGAAESHEAEPSGKRPWVARFGSWGDHEAGVRLIEDRQNRLLTIQFDEKPSEAVRKVMKDEYGYRFEPEDQLWYKRINQVKQRQSRQEAEQLAFTVANMIREEKGLEQKQSYSIGM